MIVTVYPGRVYNYSLNNMIKRIYSVLLLMAISFMTTAVFTSCGGDDDLPGGDSTSGVHRIDIQFSDDNAAKWKTTTIFYGMKSNSNYSLLYENGKQLPSTGNTYTWATDEMRDISVQTENGSVAVIVSVIIRTFDMNPSDSDITVTFVGYVNNKKIAMRSYTLPAGKMILTAEFSTEDGGRGSLVIDGEIVE